MIQWLAKFASLGSLSTRFGYVVPDLYTECRHVVARKQASLPSVKVRVPSVSGAPKSPRYSAAVTRTRVVVLPEMLPIPMRSEQVRRRDTVLPRRDRCRMRPNRFASPAQLRGNKATLGSAFEIDDRAIRTARHPDPRSRGRHQSLA